MLRLCGNAPLWVTTSDTWMNQSLIHTKFQPVSLGDTLLQRPHLLARLDASSSTTVTLVTAPAGFGKSTLISSWLEQIAGRPPITDAKQPEICWLNLDEEDSHFPTFLLYFIAAIEKKLPNSCQAVRELAQERPSPAIETLAGVLVNVLNRLDEPIILVLDDLHRISETAVFVFLARVIEFAPPQLHLVLISRADPPLPINRLRAAGRLSEFRLHDLTFSLEETTAFFQINLDSTPPASLIKTIHQRTEGWIVGVWLALLAMRGQADYAELARHIQNQTNRYTVDYLVDEVLSQQAPGVHEFLVSTAILNRFCPELCAAVLDIDVPVAAAQIEHLVRTNLFVIELGTPGHWYRYHAQFQQILLSRLTTRLDQAAIVELHRRAAAWLVARNFVSEGISHLVAIPDYNAVADLIAEAQVETLTELQFSVLEAWLNQVPLSLLNQRADLLTGMAWVKRAHVDNESCLALVRRATDLLERDSAVLSNRNRQLLGGELSALRAAQDQSLNPEETLALIQQSWALLRQHLALTHCHVILALAYASQELGELDLAIEIGSTTLEKATNWPLVARCRIAHAVGLFHLCKGDSAKAETQFQHNLLLAQQHDLPIISIISRHGLGAIADIRNQLDQAKEHRLEVARKLYLTSGRNAAAAIYSLIGIYARCGESEQSRALIEELIEDAQVIGSPFFLEQMAALNAYANLACGRREAALVWALGNPRSKMTVSSDRIPLIRVRILLAEGSRACLIEADQILQELTQFYANGRVWYRQTEILVLQALVQDGLSESDSALALLAEAVELAVPKGGIGLFTGYREVLGSLLRKLGKQTKFSQPVALLLTALGIKDATLKEEVSVQQLPEPLTKRELSVLELLAARYSNKEIARHLVVSPHTVRNHTANIYSKLHVSSRREAVDRAFAMGILPSLSAPSVNIS